MRSAVAQQHGLDEALVAQLDAAEPRLTETQVVALELADALMNDPAGATPELRDRLQQQFTRDQIVELCLDVMKWNYQKVAVALGVDREIREGELSELHFDADGNWIRPETEHS